MNTAAQTAARTAAAAATPSEPLDGYAVAPTVPAAGSRRRAAPRPVQRFREPQPPPELYEPYFDGLFTYCLSVLCDHDEAAGALMDVLADAGRHHARLRDHRLLRAWLYALARHACLQRLSSRGVRKGGSGTGGHTGGGTDGDRTMPSPVSPEVRGRRREELAALAWPEAAGTAPAQREALELAVRHGLAPHEVAAVVGLETAQARALLSRAACEVERTRTALAVAESGSCPVVARLAGDTQVLLGSALRRELVRHVDDCPGCRATAARELAAGPWPGTGTPDVLAVVQAPRAVAAAGGASGAPPGGTCARIQPSRMPSTRFDRRGFPLDGKDRAARRAQLRHRAVTTTVVAAVVAAPVLALWAAYRAGTHEGPEHDTGVSASENDYDNGVVYDGSGRSRSTAARHAASGPAQTTSPDGSSRPRPQVSPSASGSRDPRDSGDPSPSPSHPGGDVPAPSGSGSPGTPAPGRLTVSAQPQGEDTVVTLTNTGGSDLPWSARPQAEWLTLSRTSGVLGPGESITVTISVDHEREPSGEWTGTVVFEPSAAVVTVKGTGPRPSPSEPAPSETPAQ
ncbi:hypothetical protein GCM10012280_33180 [Wenjunlia tyrosinilytica]|uniref:BACON domain-containing protein n=2 Tax=Wenjunlia tyrosinilytica TaxID=1544741 RepID=A0A918DYW2_9ACTN|nr:hypothetical protein GCM10012280_33180 [Wenjunlia tyrosinilytica]